jgi:hypothetical protein
MDEMSKLKEEDRDTGLGLKIRLQNLIEILGSLESNKWSGKVKGRSEASLMPLPWEELPAPKGLLHDYAEYVFVFVYNANYKISHVYSRYKMSKEAKDLLFRMLDVVPSERISIDVVMTHRYWDEEPKACLKHEYVFSSVL